MLTVLSAAVAVQSALLIKVGPSTLPQLACAFVCLAVFERHLRSEFEREIRRPLFAGNRTRHGVLDEFDLGLGLRHRLDEIPALHAQVRIAVCAFVWPADLELPDELDELLLAPAFDHVAGDVVAGDLLGMERLAQVDLASLTSFLFGNFLRR